MKNTPVKALPVTFQGTDSGRLKLNSLMLMMYMAKYWKIKYNLTNRGFVKEDSNEDRTQAWETSDLTSALQLVPRGIPSLLSTPVPSLQHVEGGSRALHHPQDTARIILKAMR